MANMVAMTSSIDRSSPADCGTEPRAQPRRRGRVLLYLLWPASPFVSACLHYAWLLVLVSPVKKLLQPGTCTRPLSLLLFQQQLDGLCMSDTVSTEPSRPCCLSAVRCDGRIFGQLYWCRSCTDGLAHLHSGVTPELLTAAQKPAGYQTCVRLMLSH